MIKRKDLTEGSITKQLFKLALPMTAGIFAMSAFNLTDTYFVSLLGTIPLAAMSFTFPVVMIIGAIAMGLGMGAASNISRAFGEGNSHKVHRLATDSLILTVIFVAVFAFLGAMTIDPVFRMLGASDKALPLIKEYMLLWYSFVAVLFIPMVGNNTIRATGDTLTPSILMIVAAVINIILDPILIFGLFGFPRMELRGAVLATVISRALTMVVSISILHFRYKLLDFSLPSFSELWASWKKILHISIPASGTYLLIPLSALLITKLVAEYGDQAVAGAGAGQRIQMFAYIPAMAVGTALVPFIGQNWGAQKSKRVRGIWILSVKFAFLWAGVCLLAAFLFAPYIATKFSEDQAVVKIIITYLYIIFWGSAFQHISVHAGFVLNAIGKPFYAAAFTFMRMILFMVPFALIGAWLMGLNGLFFGIAASQVASGLVAMFGIKYFLVRKRTKKEPKPKKEATPEKGEEVEKKEEEESYWDMELDENYSVAEAEENLLIK